MKGEGLRDGKGEGLQDGRVHFWSYPQAFCPKVSVYGMGLLSTQKLK